MASQTPFGDKLERVKALVKAYLQEAPFLLQVYMIEQMGQDIGSEAFASSGKGETLNMRAPRNQTNRLRFVTNRLSRALTPNESGNITAVVQRGDTYFLEYGINLKQVPYARIHEYGGTINHPGGTPYKMVDGRIVFVNKRDGKDLPKTKAHTIEIKARPYLRPGYDAFLEKEVPRFYKRLAKELQ